MSERCETCRFRSDDFYVVFGSLGRQSPCRRYPPADEKKGPLVDWRHWCGEWQAKREPAKPKEREPGWYWVRVRCKGFENDWLVAEWVGAEKPWWRLGDWGHGLVDADLLEIDERRIERAP